MTNEDKKVIEAVKLFGEYCINKMAIVKKLVFLASILV